MAGSSALQKRSPGAWAGRAPVGGRRRAKRLPVTCLQNLSSSGALGWPRKAVSDKICSNTLRTESCTAAHGMRPSWAESGLQASPQER